MRWMGAAAVVAALMLVAAGCGGSNEESSSAATETVSTEAVTTETATETETDTVTDETETTSGGVTGLTGACQDLVEVSQKFGEAMAAATGVGGNDLEATSKVFEAFADEVPDEVKDDFQALAEAFAVYADAFKGVDLTAGSAPTAEQIAKIAEAMKTLDQDKLSKASAGIDAWVKENCGTTP